MNKKKLLVTTLALSLVISGGVYGITSRAGQADNTDTAVEKTMEKTITLSPSLESPQAPGTMLYFTPDEVDEFENCTFKYTATCDGKSYDVITNSDNSGRWTPSEEGTYEIKVEVTDPVGNVYESSKTYEIKKPETGLYINYFYINTGLYDVITRGSHPSIGAFAEGGSGSYNYEVGYVDENGNDFKVKEGSYIGTELPTPVIGDITYYLIATDTETNESIRKDINMHIYDCEITSIDTSVVSPAVVGDEIKFTFNTKYEINYRGSNAYSIKVTNKKNNEQVFFQREYYYTKENICWIPQEEGSYTIEAGLSSSYTGGSYTYTFDYEVAGKSDNEVTIYYKGFENPNIHYSIDNNSWTEVPGVKMDTCDYLDYTHVATIDLKDSKELVCCFNDGNNNWDSNDGKNYTFKAGKYTYFNGQIDEIKENVEDDKVVIYYTGCETPYLHYSIRGAWTSVPGIQMEECNEVAGYTHKVEVNVQGNETMTCCFNDGNGNWDNNNGNDYVLSKGVYYYNNGSLSESK